MLGWLTASSHLYFAILGVTARAVSLADDCVTLPSVAAVAMHVPEECGTSSRWRDLVEDWTSDHSQIRLASIATAVSTQTVMSRTIVATSADFTATT